MPTRLIPSPKRVAPAAAASPNKATLTSMDIELAELDGPKAGNSVDSYQPRKEDEAHFPAAHIRAPCTRLFQNEWR